MINLLNKSIVNYKAEKGINISRQKAYRLFGVVHLLPKSPKVPMLPRSFSPPIRTHYLISVFNALSTQQNVNIRVSYYHISGVRQLLVFIIFLQEQLAISNYHNAHGIMMSLIERVERETNLNLTLISQITFSLFLDVSW